MTYPDIYQEIYPYCEIPGISANRNGFLMPKRATKITQLLSAANIDYTVESFMGRSFNNFFFNIYCKGNSSLIFTAHHDITGASVGANDNSASVINLIALKTLRPDANIVFTDGEEIGGVGAQLFAEDIKYGAFPNTKAILNLELTGSGGKRFFLGKEGSPFLDAISRKDRKKAEAYFGMGLEPPPTESYLSTFISNMDQFNYNTGLMIPKIQTPFNDSVIFRQHDIDSIVINPLPPLLPNGKRRERFPNDQVIFTDGTELDFSIVSRCNGSKDTIDTIDTKDMQEFVEEVLVPIFDAWQIEHPQ
jgi:hypothetical protein